MYNCRIAGSTSVPKRIAVLGVMLLSSLPVFSAHKVIALDQGESPRIVPISEPEMTPGSLRNAYHSGD